MTALPLPMSVATEDALKDLIRQVQSEAPSDTLTRALKAESTVRRFKTWVTLVVAIAVPTVGAMGWLLNRVEAQAVTAVNEANERALTAERIARVEHRLEQIGKVVVHQQIQFVDAVEYLGERVDGAVSKRGITALVDMPETIVRARLAADAVRARSSASNLASDVTALIEPIAD